MNPILKESNASVTIYHGDCFDCLQQIENESIDLIFIDPPYNLGKKFGDFLDSWPSDEAYAEWCYQWLELCLQKLKENGSLYVMTSTQAMPYLDLWLRKKLTILSNRSLFSYLHYFVETPHC